MTACMGINRKSQGEIIIVRLLGQRGAVEAEYLENLKDNADVNEQCEDFDFHRRQK